MTAASAPSDRRKGAPPEHIRIVEVGPRDGLQNETADVAASDKAAFVDLLAASGLPIIEVASFVSPRWVPRMADAADVFRQITRRPGVRFAALVPNRTGLDRALEARADEVAVFAAASETFSRRNINSSIDESLQRYGEVCRAAAASSLPVRGYLSTCFGCPYEGPVEPARVRDLALRFLDLGVYEVALSDTIGVAHPGQVRGVLETVLQAVSADRLALHFHDTRGTALANVLASLPFGVATFDASAGGLGGCPYAPGAAGNLATEDLVYMLDGLGLQTGVRLPGVIEASSYIAGRLDHELPSRVYQAARRSIAGGGRP